jgi:hypothetical protein
MTDQSATKRQGEFGCETVMYTDVSDLTEDLIGTFSTVGVVRRGVAIG